MTANSQSDKLNALAREMECDESEDAFDEALSKIASAPPPSDEKFEDEEPAK